MKKTSNLFFLFIIIFMTMQPMVFIATAVNDIPADFCISSQETNLIKLINDFRKKKHIPAIPASRSLSFVAYTHTHDLFNHHPDEDFCNLHSWSNSDRWKNCCYTKDPSSILCMNEKPKELTHYTAPGFELIYYENDSLNLQNVMDFWQSNAPSSDFLLNTGKWAKYSWKAIGVSIYKGYVSIWVGGETDWEGIISVCSTKSASDSTNLSTIQIIPMDTVPSGRFHLITGSYPTPEQALKSIIKVKQKGFNEARIIKKDKTYRVSICDYPTLEASKKGKEKFKMMFKNIWILKY